MKKKICIITVLALIVLIFTVLLTGSNRQREFNKQTIEKIFKRAVRSSDIFEAVFFVENSKGDFSEKFGYGGRGIDTPMLTASVGKLFTTACILILREQGFISLEDKLDLYFSNEQLKGLHVFKNKEYSFDLTVSDLLHQTSGLSNIPRSLSDEDTAFTFEQRLDAIKLIKPEFAPNTGSAYYSNINFIILGEIIVKITGLSLCEAYEEMIFLPLGMENTYLPAHESDFIPHFYYGSEKINRPNNIITSGAAGGFVSTPEDLMIFIKAFWGGKLFDNEVFQKPAIYNRLKPYFGPVFYGCGYMRLGLEGIYSFFSAKGELIGHSGVTGSFAFYYPHKDLFFTGDFSQIKKPAAPYMILMRLASLAD